MVLSDLLEIAEKERQAQKSTVIRCCVAAGCLAANAQAVKQELEKAVKAANLEDRVEVRGVGCLRLCCQGPLVQVDPLGILYQRATADGATALVAALSGDENNVPHGD